MRSIDDHLGVRRIVDRCEDAPLDPDLFVQNLHDRRQRVGGAGRCGEDVVLGGFVDLVIAPDDDVGHPRTRHRCCNDHLAGTGCEVLFAK